MPAVDHCEPQIIRALSELQPALPIYLAIPQAIYDKLFQTASVKRTVVQAALKLIVVDLEREVVTTWIH